MKIICDWENCDQTGSYKAPLEKDNSRKYRLLCLEHIKLFNKKWNYFSDMSDQQIEYFIKSDLTWHKSTKSFGSSENFFKDKNNSLVSCSVKTDVGSSIISTLGFLIRHLIISTFCF